MNTLNSHQGFIDRYSGDPDVIEQALPALIFPHSGYEALQLQLPTDNGTRRHFTQVDHPSNAEGWGEECGDPNIFI